MIFSIIGTVLLIVIDFFIKRYFVGIYDSGQIEVIIPEILNLGFIKNTGASFGMLQGQQMLFFFITLIALGAFGFFFASSNWKDKKVYSLAFILLIAGTAGNGIDRLLLGYVIDYIQIPFLPIVGSTVFNLADTLLIAGIILLFIDVIFLDSKRIKKNKTIEKDINEQNN